ncbi:unnamed protein product [Paramecium octaurelia]|uniref:Uncharacterized protein n=1 Tax=Paramecium octaurelia TaxID=43137 RepID=A0A8S1YRJ4_PAROT|nr:unnamed protein product [Paramecium octaurelia]
MIRDQVLDNQIEWHMNEIEKHLDQCFDNINNFIDQVFFIDSSISKSSNPKFELTLPKIHQFQLIHQSDFQSRILQQLKPLINSKIKDECQFQQQQQQHQQSLIIQQQQSNLKPFTYQIIKEHSIKQSEFCLAIAFNKDSSIVATGCNEQIKIYEFKQGMLKLIQVLNQHNQYVNTLNFMKKSNQIISGDQSGSILIWSSNNNTQWNCSQTIKGHINWVNCLILNYNEDIFISSSQDKTIKFWIKQNEWICQQTITDHTSYVYQISLNEQQNKLISCGADKKILVIEYSEQSQKWIVIQKINVECYGIRICFINNNLFTFQPIQGNLMHVYEMNSVSKQFLKTKDIDVNQGQEGYTLFPQQFIKQKQLLVNKHDKYVNFIRITQKDQFKLEQSIQFGHNLLFGQLSDDGQYFITWDRSNNEIQIRTYIEQ